MRKELIITLIFLITVIAGSILLFPYMDSSPYTVREDSDGVPVVDYKWLMGQYVGEQRYPVAVADRADKYYRYYIETGDPEHLRRFQNNLRWLKNNKREINGSIVFPTNFEFPFYDCKEGWVSGMAQGLALKDFTHAYELTGEKEYLYMAEKIVASYKLEMADGGILYIDPEDGGHWYAEYACGREPPRVLNGFWFALEGLYHYHNQTGDEETKTLYEEGVKELVRHLPDFDTGSWTHYDLKGYPANQDYHQLHIKIMSDFYNRTGDPQFQEYQERWETYRHSQRRYYTLFMKALIFNLI